MSKAKRRRTVTVVLDQQTLQTACREHLEATWNVEVSKLEIRRRKGKGLEVIATIAPEREEEVQEKYIRCGPSRRGSTATCGWGRGWEE